MGTKHIKYLILLLGLNVVPLSGAWAQKYPERKHIRQGNKDYEKGDYSESEIDYRKALEKSPGSFQALFNLGNSLFRQDMVEEAGQIFEKIAGEAPGSREASVSHYNAGNTHFEKRELEAALESYKNALRNDPTDMEAKFNLAYVKKLLEKDDDDDDNNNDGGGGGGGGNDDQNQDNDQDNNQDNNDNKDDQEQDQNQDNNDDKNDNDDNKDNKDDNDPPPQGERPQDGGMTREEAQQLLDAIQMNEDKTKDKMDERRAKVIQNNDKNW